MKKAIKVALAAGVLCGVIFGSIKLLELTKKKEVQKKYSVISTSFPGYDFARAVAGKNTDIDVKMLLKPGAESHTFEPTPQDILAIKNSNLFVYVGGDSDEWVKKIISEIDPKKTKVMKLVDLVKTKNEELVEGMEDEDHDHDHEDHGHDHDHKHDHDHDHDHKHDHDHDHDDHKGKDEDPEVDEHVWTSLKNAKVITDKIMKEMVAIDREEEAKLTENGKSYMAKIEATDKKIADMVKRAERKEIIVADRFPLRYFVDDYGIKYYAAFPGCSEQTEANTKTISFIVNKVKEDKIPAVFKIELSNGQIAEIVAKETGAKILEFQSAHNISERDFGSGVTYVDLMERNFDVLKQALNN